MALYRTDAQSPFHNALNASGNAANIYGRLAYMRSMGMGAPKPTLGRKVKKGLQGVLAAARQGQIIGEYGAGQGWWFNDYEKDENGRWRQKPQAQPTAENAPQGPPVRLRGDPYENDRTPYPATGGKRGDPMDPAGTKMPRPATSADINPQGGQNPQQQPATDTWYGRMWNTPGGRGALIGAGLGILGTALDYF